MDFSKFNFQIGKDFSAKVRSLIGSQVPPSGDPAGLVFHLLVSFSRNRFRLTEDSVDTCLKSVLGGNSSDDFEVFHLEEQIFRFAVSSKQVGLMVIKLNSVACDWFKLGFFLLNDGGFKKALAFAKSDSGPSYPWKVSDSRSSRNRPFAHVASTSIHPLSGANCTPLGPLNRFRPDHPSAQRSSRSVFSRLQFPRQSVFIDSELQIRQRFLNLETVKGLHRFMGQAAQLSRGPIL
jgi:hypothetical protein